MLSVSMYTSSHSGKGNDRQRAFHFPVRNKTYECVQKGDYDYHM